MSSVQKKTTRTTKTVTTKKTEQVQSSSVDQSANVQSSIDQKFNNLSIVKKGQFFNDSYFEDNRQDFQDAIQDVLAKWGDKSKPTNDINSYRDLRARDLRDENQAIRSTEDQRYHKIVVDVQDFISGGEVSVKTLDDIEIVVEGRVQRKTGNKTSTKTFKRSFILPDIEPESVTSVVSSDGILIIKALKKVSEMDGSQSVTVQKTVVQQQQVSSVQTSGQQDVKQTTITVQGSQPAVAGPQPDQQKTVTVTKVKKITSDTGGKPLPIAQKGGFFEDTFFEDCRQHYQKAVKQVLQKCNVTSTDTDDLTTYRNLRQRDLREENQVATVDDEEQFQKIIVDVKDFLNGGDVTVKTVEDREVVIEGHIEKQEGNKKTTKRFCKRFILPEDIVMEAVTSVVSSDGVLTITAPRKPSEGQDVSQSVTVQKTVVKKQQISSVDQQQPAVKDTNPQQTKVTRTKRTKIVTITTTKVPFFTDPDFAEDVKDFQEAITTIIKKMKLTVTQQTDAFTSYRNRRKINPRNENQAISEKETDTTKKIVMDVCDFIGGVTVKIDEQILTVQGKGNRHTEGGGVQTFSFNRQFCLPDDVNPDDITAVMTPDGILIITIITKQSITSVVTKEESTKKTVTQLTKETTDVGTTKAITTEEPKKAPTETDVAKKTTITTTTKIVTITTKGPFFNDPTFVEDVKDFQEAITTIIKKLNLTVTNTDVFTAYRNHRKTNPKIENQAVSEKDTDTTRKIVIDVCDFVGNVTVKVVDRELIIEGEGKRTTETGAVQTIRFIRRFSLPEDVNPNDITAVMSSEGVLIITIIRRITKVTQVKKDTTDVKQIQTKKTTTDEQDAKKKKTTTTSKKTVTITTKGPFFKDSTFVEDVKNFEQSITTVIKKFNLKITEKDAYTTYRNYRKANPKNENQAVSEKETDKTKKIVIDVSDFSESVTAKVEERELVIEGTGKRQTTTGAIQTFSFNRHFCLPEGATTDDITAVKSSEGILSVSIKKTVTSSITTTTTEASGETSTKGINITVKGPFFSDPAFANSIKEFQSSITTVIKKFKVKVTGTDTFTAYRNFRKENPKNENQAVSVNETETVKKVVMDVCDFVGAVTAKVEGKEVVVSGTGKRQKGGAGPVITFSFGRRFTLYDNTIIEAITAVMSSEGILTITIPRKQ